MLERPGTLPHARIDRPREREAGPDGPQRGRHVRVEPREPRCWRPGQPQVGGARCAGAQARRQRVAEAADRRVEVDIGPARGHMTRRAGAGPRAGKRDVALGVHDTQRRTQVDGGHVETPAVDRRRGGQGDVLEDRTARPLPSSPTCTAGADSRPVAWPVTCSVPEMRSRSSPARRAARANRPVLARGRRRGARQITSIILRVPTPFRRLIVSAGTSRRVPSNASRPATVPDSVAARLRMRARS